MDNNGLAPSLPNQLVSVQETSMDGKADMNITTPLAGPYHPQAGLLASFIQETNFDRSLQLSGIKRNLTRGSTLLHEEDKAKYIYDVVAGTIKAVKILVDGRRQVIGFFSAGDIIGLPLEYRAYYSLEAVTASTVLCYPITQIDAAMGHSPDLTKLVFAHVHSELEKQMDHMISLGRKRPKERVASFLLKYYRRRQEEGFADGGIELPMSRVDISDYLGLTQETVCRVLSLFKRRGIISARNSHQIQILDLPSLEHIAQSGLIN